MTHINMKINGVYQENNDLLLNMSCVRRVSKRVSVENFVEFIVNIQGHSYFQIEVKTRLQEPTACSPPSSRCEVTGVLG